MVNLNNWIFGKMKFSIGEPDIQALERSTGEWLSCDIIDYAYVTGELVAGTEVMAVRYSKCNAEMHYYCREMGYDTIYVVHIGTEEYLAIEEVLRKKPDSDGWGDEEDKPFTVWFETNISILEEA